MPTHPEVVTLDPNDAGLMGELWHAAKGTPREFAEHVRALVNPLPPEPPLWTLVRLGNGRIALREDEESGWADYWVHADVLPGSAKANSTAMTWPEVCALGTPEVLEPDSVKALREQVERLKKQRDAERSAAKDAEERYEIAHQSFMASQGEVDTRNLQMQDMHRTLDSIQKQAKEWAEKDVSGALGGEALVVTNRHGREILHLLDATEDEPAEPAPVEELAEWERALLAEVTEEPPVGSEVTDRDDDVWERRSDGWRLAGGKIRHEWTDVEEFRPLTLVETGGQS